MRAQDRLPSTPSPATRTRTNCAATSKAITGNIKKIAVIHGEEDASPGLSAETLRELKPKAEVLVPEYQQILEV